MAPAAVPAPLRAASQPAAQEPPQPREAAPAQGGEVPAEAWRKMLGVVAAQRPAIHNALLSAKIAADGNCALKLFLANKFSVTMIEKALPELEEILAKAAGKKIKLSAALAGDPKAQPAAPVSVRPDPVQPAAAPLEAGPAPQDDLQSSDPDEAELNDTPPLPSEGERPAPRAKTGESHAVDSSTEPELKHLAKVFHGRITRINKIK